REAREGGARVELTLIYIDEEEPMERVAESIRGQGFLGRRACEQVITALEDERNRAASEREEHASELARAAGFDLEVRRENGIYAQLVIRFAEQKHYDVIYVARSHRSRLRRALLGSEVDEVVRYAKAAADHPSIHVEEKPGKGAG
ncbi:MAG: universal stress protein, partial [Planctomycetota bacterium]|nr:universal stress protein [Planctomycetota bacterium]